MKRSFYQFPAGVIEVQAVLKESAHELGMGVIVQVFTDDDDPDTSMLIAPDSDSTTGVRYIEKGESAAIVIPVYAALADISLAFRMIEAARRLYPGIKIMKGSKEADTSLKAENRLWQSSQKEVFNNLNDEIYVVIEGSFGTYRLLRPFLEEKYPGRTLDELVGLAFNDFAQLMISCRNSDSFGTAEITAPNGEEFQAILLTNRDAGASLLDKVVICTKGEPKIVDTDAFRDFILTHPSFTVYDISSFSMTEMSDDEWDVFCEAIPGEQLPERKTYLLRWNPAISSFKAEHYDDACKQFDGNWCMDWSVYEYQEAQKGDRYFMLREGDGVAPGIYFCGEFISNPYEGKDWAGTDRKRYYVDLTCEEARPLADGPWITTEELEAAIPEINWRRGHSGQLLTPDQAETLHALWNKKTDECK